MAPSESGNEPTTGRVAYADADGVYVSPIGGDARSAVGPCRGARRRDAEGDLRRLPNGTVVLLVWTDEGPWIAAAEEGE